MNLVHALSRRACWLCQPLSLLVTLAAIGSSAFATVGTWSGSTGGTWSTAATNWTGVSGTPWDSTNGATNTAIFATGSLNNVVSGTVYTNGITFNTSGTIGGTGAVTLAGASPFLSAATSAITGTFNADIAGASGLTKLGAGVIVLQGAAKTLTGGLTVNQGTLRLNLATATTGVVDSGNAVALAGGTLNVQGNTTGTSSQTLGNLTLNEGSSTISLNPNGGTGTTLTLGNTWTQIDGGTLLIDLSSVSAGTRTVTSAPTLDDGIIGGYAMVKDATSTGFATVVSGNVVRYTGGTVITGTLATDTDSTLNYVTGVSAAIGGPSSTQTVNSLEVTGGNNLSSSVAKTLVVASGGVLFSGATNAQIATNISLTSGTSELDVYTLAPNGTDSSINGVIKDNGSTSVSLVKWGTGTLFLNSANTYTGDTIINGGAIKASQIPYGAGKGDLVINSGGTYIFGGAGTKYINGLSNSTPTGGAINRGTYGDAPATSFLNLGNNDATASFSGTIANVSIIKSGTGTQTFAGINTYAGTTAVNAGTLQIGSAGVGTSGTGAVTVNTGATLTGTGTVQGSTFTATSGSSVQAGDGTAATNFGTLTFKPASGSGYFDFQSGSTTTLGLNPGGTGDLLNIDGLSAGTLNFNGNLTITAPGYIPTGIATFNLLDWANISSVNFDNRFKSSSYSGYLYGNGDDNLGFDLPDISGTGYAWDISQFTTNGTISIVPEPSRALLTMSGLMALALRRVRRKKVAAASAASGDE